MAVAAVIVAAYDGTAACRESGVADSAVHQGVVLVPAHDAAHVIAAAANSGIAHMAVPDFATIIIGHKAGHSCATGDFGVGEVEILHRVADNITEEGLVVAVATDADAADGEVASFESAFERMLLVADGHVVVGCFGVVGQVGVEAEVPAFESVASAHPIGQRFKFLNGMDAVGGEPVVALSVPGHDNAEGELSCASAGADGGEGEGVVTGVPHLGHHIAVALGDGGGVVRPFHKGDVPIGDDRRRQADDAAGVEVRLFRHVADGALVEVVALRHGVAAHEEDEDSYEDKGLGPSGVGSGMVFHGRGIFCHYGSKNMK